MTTDTPFTIDNDQRKEIVRQIGRMNILSISGGRVTALPDGVSLPVSNGFSVEVRLTSADDYTVERVFKRAGKRFSHGLRDRVYFDEVGETAYKASCFRNDDAAYWPEAIEAKAARS